MARFYVSTAIQENYGAHDWDGTGDCPQHWKNKGRTEYVVEVADSDFAAATDDQVKSMLHRLSALVAQDTVGYREMPVASGIIPSGCHTDGEQYFLDLVKNGVAEPSDRHLYEPYKVDLALI